MPSTLSLLKNEVHRLWKWLKSFGLISYLFALLVIIYFVFAKRHVFFCLTSYSKDEIYILLCCGHYSLIT